MSHSFSRIFDQLGFCSLTEPPSHYGLALALGDAEVSLVDLANAYATLARGGLALPVRGLRSITRASGGTIMMPLSSPERVLDEAATYLVTDVLADKDARISSFGEGSVLELPFATAAKTGTSKGYRDNIAVGFTPAVTVAVWVGNFDGSPMKGVSGITGAGPLFRSSMLAASRRRTPEAFAIPDGVRRVDVCSLSGELPGPACDHTRSDVELARRPIRERCDMHIVARIDPASGLLAGPACPESTVEHRVFERYPARFLEWARSVGRPLAPTESAARCPAPHASSEEARIVYPEDGARFSIDDSAAAPNAIRIRVAVPPGAHSRLEVDGVAVSLPADGLVWTLVRGVHARRLMTEGGAADEVTFSVE